MSGEPACVFSAGAVSRKSRSQGCCGESDRAGLLATRCLEHACSTRSSASVPRFSLA